VTARGSCTITARVKAPGRIRLRVAFHPAAGYLPSVGGAVDVTATRR
jgi:hypothetical protein